MLGALKRLFHGSRETLAANSTRRIEAVRQKGSIEITVNGITYSRVEDTPYTHAYWDYFAPLCYLYETPRVLLIGLGGGTIARQINASFGSAAKIDAVEIDSEMAAIAQKFSTIDANIIIGDGAQYIKGLRNLYDIIILDAYVNLSIPPQFLTREFVDDAIAALSPKGIMAINFTSEAMKGSTMNWKEYVRKRFDAMEMDLNTSLNSIVILSKRMDAKEIRKKVAMQMHFGAETMHIWNGYMHLHKFG